MRLIVSLEGNSEGKVLASVDMEEIVKMTITDDIEKSNFNPQMLKSCTDSSYQCGYQQGRVDAIDEVKEKLNNAEDEITFNLPVEEILGADIDLDDFVMLVQDAVQVYRKMVLGVLEQLKEQK